MRWLLASVLALAAACGSGTRSTTPTTPLPPDKPPATVEKPPGATLIDANAKYDELAKRACDCKAKAKLERAPCAREVVKDMVAFATDHTEAPGDGPRAEAAGEQIGKCVIDAGLPIEELNAELKKVPAPKPS
jgi:hypothetical protein